jgi:putative membrane protein
VAAIRKIHIHIIKNQMKNIMILLLAGSFYASAQNPESKDAKFIQKAIEDGMLEVRLGELAQKQGSAAEVKLQAAKMVEDHGRATAELKELAAKKGITSPSALNKCGQKKHDALSRYSGEAFDKKYSRCMVKYHKKAISLFKKEAVGGTDKELKTWAAQKIPVLENHLSAWEESCKALKKGKAAAMKQLELFRFSAILPGER